MEWQKQSLLTGESKSVKKLVGDNLLGGSYVVGGSCKAIAVKVGNESYSSSLIKKARELKQNKSENKVRGICLKA